MATPRIFKIKGRTYDANALMAQARIDIGQLVDARVAQVVNDIETEIYKFISEMTNKSAEPRSRGIVDPRSRVKPRDPAFKDLLIEITAEDKLVARGRYTGKLVSTANLSVYGPMGLKNAFNAMDTGIPSRTATGKPMRFPRYEGNMTGRSGSLYPVTRISVGSARRDQSKSNWVTKREVGPSEPFHILPRIRAAVRKSESLIQTLNNTVASDLAKIKIKIITPGAPGGI